MGSVAHLALHVVHAHGVHTAEAHAHVHVHVEAQVHPAQIHVAHVNVHRAGVCVRAQQMRHSFGVVAVTGVMYKVVEVIVLTRVKEKVAVGDVVHPEMSL